MKKLFTIILLSFSVFTLSAQDKSEMVTDRPDQTESANVMPVKSFQLETGFLFERYDKNINNTTYNSSLLRYGLIENLEVRLGFEYVGTNISLEGGDFDKSGFGPLTLGAKVFLREEGDGLPKLAFLSTLSIPNTGSSAFENNNLGADFRLNGEYSLNDALSFGANVGIAWSGVEGEDYAVGIYTAVIGMSLSEKLGAFAELYGFLPGEGKNDHRWDGGLTYAVNEDLQLDLSTGVGLSKVSPDFFISLGLSIRMP